MASHKLTIVAIEARSHGQGISIHGCYFWLPQLDYAPHIDSQEATDTNLTTCPLQP